MKELQEERREDYARGIYSGLKAIDPVRASAVVNYLEKKYGTTQLGDLGYTDLIEAHSFVGKVVRLEADLGLLVDTSYVELPTDYYGTAEPQGYYA
jgi:hypothetical protein